MTQITRSKKKFKVKLFPSVKSSKFNHYKNLSWAPKSNNKLKRMTTSIIKKLEFNEQNDEISKEKNLKRFNTARKLKLIKSSGDIMDEYKDELLNNTENDLSNIRILKNENNNIEEEEDLKEIKNNIKIEEKEKKKKREEKLKIIEENEIEKKRIEKLKIVKNNEINIIAKNIDNKNKKEEQIEPQKEDILLDEETELNKVEIKDDKYKDINKVEDNKYKSAIIETFTKLNEVDKQLELIFKPEKKDFLLINFSL